MPATEALTDKRWHCENCNKVLAAKRGVGTVIECRGCGYVNVA